MANTDTPFGFKPVKTGSGAAGSNFQVNWYPVLATNAIMAVGDPVIRTSSGEADRWGTTGALTESVGPVLGVAAGFRRASGESYPNTASDGLTPERTYIGASIGAGWEVAVWDDPQQWFEVQADNGAITGSTYFAQTDVGRTADILGAAATQFGTGAARGRSNYELDTSSADDDVNAAAPLTIVGISKAIGNVADGTSASEFCKLIVVFTSHWNRGAAPANSQNFGI